MPTEQQTKGNILNVEFQLHLKRFRDQEIKFAIPAGANAAEIAAHIVECCDVCQQFDEPARDIAELIDGFFQGVGEVNRDDFVYYFTVRRPCRTDSATVILSNAQTDAAQRIADCLQACERFDDPAASIAAIRDATLKECADTANAIDSGRGNEKQIAAAILEKLKS